MPGYRTESSIIKHANDIKGPWLDLQSHADYSYFQSWGWIETWLNQIAIDLQPVAVKVWFDESLIGIGLFVSRDIKRRNIFTLTNSRVIVLHLLVLKKGCPD